MEYYYLTGDKNISELCRKWASWAMENTYLHSDGSYEIPCTLEWSGQPDTWTGKPSSNKNLHCTIKDWTVDAGVTAALAKALIYYAAATEKHEKALNEKARETSKQLLDRMWIDYKDDLGISSPESRDDFKRFFDEVYVPVDFSGTNAQGAEIKNGTTFIEMRPKYKSDPGFSAIEQAVNSGTAPLMKYHRYWVQAEIAMANAMYHIYFEHTGNGTVPGIKQEVNKGDSPTPDNTPVVTPIETSDPTPTVTSTQTPEPTNTPTIMPTGTNNSTHTPTIKPTPTHKATNTPTKRPTYTPTKKPTNTPTKKPTNTPTKKPTNTPTKRPTYTPTKRPTKRPTNTPTKRPTYTPTKRPTNTPTKKPATPSNKVLLQYYNNNANEMTSNINVSIKLTNNSDSSIRLSDVKIRYYYTIDGEKPQNFACDWSTVGSSNVTGRFAKLPSSSSSADYYLEIGFTDGAGSLESNTSIDIQTRFWKSDWSNYILNNDYSTSSGKIALYVSGKLVSGSEP